MLSINSTKVNGNVNLFYFITLFFLEVGLTEIINRETILYKS